MTVRAMFLDTLSHERLNPSSASGQIPCCFLRSEGLSNQRLLLIRAWFALWFDKAPAVVILYKRS
jgi:hypothetical protein